MPIVNGCRISIIDEFVWRIRLEAMFSLLGGNLALCSLFLVYLDETELAFGRYPLSLGWLVYVYIPSLQPPLITYFPSPGVWLPLVGFFVSAAALFAINRQVAGQRRSHVRSV
jgi:hypothetical protein